MIRLGLAEEGLSMRTTSWMGVAILGSWVALTLGFQGREATAWNQWRGEARDGISPGDPWPESLAEDRLKLLWKTSAGPAYSGAVLDSERVFIAETVGEGTEGVRALDRATGRELWAARWEGGAKVSRMAAAHGDWIKSTPAADGKNLYVVGMGDLLICLDASTGEERWRVDFLTRFAMPKPNFGAVTSPIVGVHGLFVQAAGSLVKLDPSDGKILWRALEPNKKKSSAAFASPVMATIGGAEQLVVQTRDELAGVDPASGAVLWREPVKAFQGMNMVTPVVYKEGIFTSPYRENSILLQVKPVQGGYSVTRAWKQKARGNMSTALVMGDHLYLHLGNRRVACLDLRSGERTWISPKRFGVYWSMVGRGDRILGLDGGGELFLMRANPERFELLDSRSISDTGTWAHLAVAGDQVFIRRLDGLDAYQWN